jgi:hypothetical protein
MPNLQLHYGDRAAYAVRAAAFVDGSTVAVTSSDGAAVVVEPDTAFVPVESRTGQPGSVFPGEAFVVARGTLVGGSKMAENVKVETTITHPDGGITHATLYVVDVVGSPITFQVQEPVPMPAPLPKAPTPQPIRLTEAEREQTNAEAQAAKEAAAAKKPHPVL